MNKNKDVIAIVENFGFEFYNFRIPLVKYFENKGFKVFVIVPHDNYLPKIQAANIEPLSFTLKKNSISIISFIQAIKELRNFNKDRNFSIVHSFKLQPNILTCFAFGFNKNVKIVNHVTGLGYAFTSKTFKSLVYRFITIVLYQIAFLLSDRIIVQNNEDRKILSRLLFISKKIDLVKGIGIDDFKFNRKNVDKEKVSLLKNSISLKHDEIVVTFIGRLIIEKGIKEFLIVANKIIKIKKNIKFVIAGWFDKNNPSCLKEYEFYNYTKSANIIYLGQIFDVRELLYITNILVLPTYREGFPRSVLEAMAMEVPVITTSVPGAQEAVINNLNGLIVKPKNTEELKCALLKLIENPELRSEMGKNGRILVEKNYKSEIIFNQIFEIYKEILNKKL